MIFAKEDSVQQTIRDAMLGGGKAQVVPVVMGPAKYAVQIIDNRGRKVGNLIFPPEGEGVGAVFEWIGKVLDS